jgi:hypothetical protein
VIKQDRRDTANIHRTRSHGWANLAGLQNEPPHREIDWLVFSKALTGSQRSDRMATLVFPFTPATPSVPADVSVERVDLNDTAAIGYRVLAKDREDLIIISDGRYRKFSGKIEGDFTYARISSVAGRVEYAGFTGVSRLKIEGVAGQSFPARTDFEYQP